MERVCSICGKPKNEWSVVKHDNYCPDCYEAVVESLRNLKKSLNYGYVEKLEIKDAINDLFEYAFPKGGVIND